MNRAFDFKVFEGLLEPPRNIDKELLHEISSLGMSWRSRQDQLQNTNPQALAEFKDQIVRSWSIETGVIERVYTISDGMTKILVENGLDASLIRDEEIDIDKHRFIDIVSDHKQAVEMCIDVVQGARPLTIGFIQELHACVMDHQRFMDVEENGQYIKRLYEPGRYRTHESYRQVDGQRTFYCPPEQISYAVAQLLERLEANNAISPIVLSAWFHHRYTLIHPYPDGNGRISRILSNLILIKDGLLPIIVKRNDDGIYLQALRSADSGDLVPLIRLFIKKEKELILQALSLESQRISDSSSLLSFASQIAEGYRSRIEAKESELRHVSDVAFDLMNKGQEYTYAQLNEVRSQFMKAGLSISYVTAKWGGPGKENHPAGYFPSTNHYYLSDVFALGREHEFYTNTSEDRYWFKISFKRGEQTFEYIVVASHIGRTLTGTATVVNFVRLHLIEDEGESILVQVPTMTEPFTFSYKDSANLVFDRFKQWLEDGLILGLAEWQRRI